MSEAHRVQPDPIAPSVPVEPPAPPQVEAEAPPPFLSSWRNLYVLLVAELALLVVVFYALARWAS